MYSLSSSATIIPPDGERGVNRRRHAGWFVSRWRWLIVIVGLAPAAVMPMQSNGATSGSGGWTTVGAMGSARAQHTAILLRGGQVLVTGGYDDKGRPLASAELYNPATTTWTSTGPMTVARGDHTATLLSDGRVLVAGGLPTCYPPCNALTSAELYTPSTGSWTPTGPMVVGRFGHTATLLPNGKVLVVGGESGAGAGAMTLASAELYDPSTGLWAPTGALAAARSFHTATLLASGKVLVAGGDPFSYQALRIASAELYDPGTGMWTPTSSMTTARSYFTATLLGDGKVLAAGGAHDGNNSAEVYDPSVGTWTLTSPMIEVRRDHTATLLPSGQVLVSGGANATAGALASAELYEPATGTWTAAGALSIARYEHAAVLLPDDHVLVMGGCNRLCLGLDSSEVYAPAPQQSGSGATPTPVAHTFQVVALPFLPYRLTLNDVTHRVIVVGRQGGSLQQPQQALPNSAVGLLDAANGTLLHAGLYDPIASAPAVDERTGHFFLVGGGTGRPIITMFDGTSGGALYATRLPRFSQVGAQTNGRVAIFSRLRRVFVADGREPMRSSTQALAILNADTATVVGQVRVAEPPGPLLAVESVDRLIESSGGLPFDNSPTTAVVAVDAASGMVVRRRQIGMVAGDMVADEQMRRVFVLPVGIAPGNAVVTILDAHNGAPLRQTTVGINPTALAVDARRGQVVVVNMGGFTPAGGFAGNGGLSVLDAWSGRVVRTIPLDLRPIAVALDTDHERAYVVEQGLQASPEEGQGGQVVVVDLHSGKVVQTVDVGLDPHAVVVDEATHRAFVAASLPGAASAGGSVGAARGAVYVLDTEAVGP